MCVPGSWKSSVTAIHDHDEDRQPDFRELVPRHEVQGRVQIVAELCQLILFHCSCLCYAETSLLPSQHLASVSSEECFRYESWKCG